MATGLHNASVRFGHGLLQAPAPSTFLPVFASYKTRNRRTRRCLLNVSKISSRSRCKVMCFFNFGKPQVKSKTRDDFDRTDVEEYFNYMGMLAVEGSYNKMEALLQKKIHPVDILLLLAASEGDKPKIEELMQAGADYTVTDVEGKTALDRAADEETRSFIMKFSKGE
eukprot:TRINITY_DN35362_c0_g1_i1.p1 TRINITY_DN35362_c0_g1~~TRINITY_DN35362_c0_g1_i1.p1  ORF type:complete len:168 (-),score=33.93 TRINITY_DN35362_c0_g1_i1:146-649(-)